MSTTDAESRLKEFLAPLIREEPLLSRIAGMAGPGMVYLVGGLIRDILSDPNRSSQPEADGEKGPGDVDLAVRYQALEFGGRVAGEAGARLVVLSRKDRTVRLVSPNLSIDLTEFRRPSLTADLRARDFTINAMALDLHRAAQGEYRLIDPCGGLEDLGQGLVRAVSEDSLVRDPLRTLRAYRIAAERGFIIDPKTRGWIKSLAPGLAGIAGERVRAELLRLLSIPDSAPWLDLMARDRVLAAVLPEVAHLEGLTQNRYHHLDGLAHTLEALTQAEQLLASGRPDWVGGIAADPSRTLFVKLALLFHDTGKKDTAAPRPDGGISFTGHEKLSADLWREAAHRLKLSTEMTKAVELLILAHMRPLSLLLAERITPRARMRLVRYAGEYLPELGLVCLADSLATAGPEKDPNAEDLLLKLWEDLRETRETLHSQAGEPLIRGDDLIRKLGLAPGPIIGRLLSGIEEARLAGEVQDREGALEWARGEVDHI